MNNPFDTFDKIYCIHLPQHNERLKLIEQEFEKVGFNNRVQYIHATPPQNGFNITNMRRNPKAEFGVSLSQIKAVVHAIHDNAKQPFFCEDDIVFHTDAQQLFSNVLNELPSDWEMLYFGGHPRGKHSKASRYSKTLAKIGRMSFADSYCIKGHLLIKWFDMWTNNIGRPKDGMYDFILGDFAFEHNSYCTIPLLCEQRVGHSYIGNKYDDKRDLVKRGWMHHLSA